MNLEHSIKENGQASNDSLPPLSERVRSLRLPEKAAQGGGFPVVPWMLVFFLGIACSVLTYLAFFSPAKVSDEDIAQAVADARSKDPSNDAGRNAQGGSVPTSKDGKVLEAKGYILAKHQVQVSPKVGGMVMEMNFEEGMWVPENYVLARLERVEYQSEYDRAVAQVESAKRRHDEMVRFRQDEINQVKAELDEAIALRDQNQKKFARYKELRRQGSISPEEFESAESSSLTTQAKVIRLDLAFELAKKGPRDEKIASAMADWKLAEADLRKAKWRLDNTVVTAPIAGTILTKKAEKGSMVNPGFSNNNLAASFCEMADLSEMEVDLAIAERDINRIFKGQKCKLYAEAFTDRIYEGYVSRIMPIADRARTSVPVRVKILIPKEEEGKFLRPDMGAVVTFFKDTSDKMPPEAEVKVANKKD